MFLLQNTARIDTKNNNLTLITRSSNITDDYPSLTDVNLSLSLFNFGFRSRFMYHLSSVIFLFLYTFSLIKINDKNYIIIL